MKNSYEWEAEKASGEIIKSGGDISGCVRFSLIPKVPLLRRIDIVGVKMVRRFCKGFINVMNGTDKGYVHCVECEGCRIYVNYSNGQVLVTPQDYSLRL